MNTLRSCPRLVIAALAGDSGKTLVSLALLWMLRERAVELRAFKKGPDYIDAAWLTWACGQPARSLDSFLMGFETCVSSFSRAATPSGINLVEGNRGLYDGSDARGTHSTAELAKRLQAPVLLVVDATKMTRTAAACVLGCRNLDAGVDIAGVILNRVGGARHENVVRAAVETDSGVRVLGVLPRAAGDAPLPARHLGLVTPDEHPRIGELKNTVLELAQGRIDLDSICTLAERAPALEPARPIDAVLPDARGLRIGYMRDSALSFYYPENLEAIENAGAALVPFSPLTAIGVPHGLDALYIGGGFPETHGAALSANQDFLASLRSAAAQGLPIYAECGGLMLLAQAIRWQGLRYPMAGVFAWEVEVLPSPQGHGYVELVVDRPNPFFPHGIFIRGHEFHYSRILIETASEHTACAVRRGTGSGQGRDGWVQQNVWASYTHLHALGTPEWAMGLLTAAGRYQTNRGRS